MKVIVRNTTLEDIPGIIQLCEAVYPGSPAWSPAQIESHLEIFPEGQFVAVQKASNRLVGMASSLIIDWNDYELEGSWRDFTAGGFFRNHDPVNGRTLYGAEIMVDPTIQGQGIGKMLYVRREKLVIEKRLLRIRAGARLRGYSNYAEKLRPDEYIIEVIRGKIIDPTLTFQLKRGFTVFGMVADYLRHDPESRGYAALIEWINDEVAKPEDFRAGDPRFQIKGKWSKPKQKPSLT